MHEIAFRIHLQILKLRYLPDASVSLVTMTTWPTWSPRYLAIASFLRITGSCVSFIICSYNICCFCADVSTVCLGTR